MARQTTSRIEIDGQEFTLYPLTLAQIEEHASTIDLFMQGQVNNFDHSHNRAICDLVAACMSRNNNRIESAWLYLHLDIPTLLEVLPLCLGLQGIKRVEGEIEPGK